MQHGPMSTPGAPVAALFGAALALLLSACGDSGGSRPPGSAAALAAGERVFMQTCASCHGRDARGLPNLGTGLHGSELVKSHSEADLVAFLAEGRRATDPRNTTGIDMPPKGGNPALTQDDLRNVAAYLRTF